MNFKEPFLKNISETRFVGMRLEMSLSENKTTTLWQRFMPRYKEINHKINTDLYSIQVYDTLLDFNDFTPNTVFEKWAAVAVEDLDQIPDKMESIIIPEGKYAVFVHRGIPSMFYKTVQYIFGKWLPNSKYQLDNRPHFEIMNKNYKPDDPKAEETVWIPIR
ncbi:MAG: GyrI-like domain-containing protein [Bacteroidota bacterium]